MNKICVFGEIIYGLAFLSLTMICGLLAAEGGEEKMNIGNPFDDDSAGIFLALDPTLFENKKDIALVPVSGQRHPANPVLTRGGPDTHSESRVGLPHVRFERDRFHMWYLAGDGRFLKYKGGPLHKYQDSYEGMWLCYAESSDGIHWTKPELNLYEFNGSKKNNIIGKGACPSFMYDSADPDPARRYKCIFDWWDKNIPFSNYTGTSSDGIHWNYDFRYFPHESMETPNIFRWGERIHSLVQVFDPLVRTPDPGGLARRVNALFITKDFKHWQRVPGIAFQIPRQDPMRPGFDMQCHCGPAVYNAGRFSIGVFGRFVAPSSDQSETRTSLGMCLSDDGRHFFEPFWKFDLLPRPKDDTAWDAHMLHQPAGPSLVEVSDEWWMYYSGSHGGNVWNGVPAIGIAIWRKQGFAYLTSLHETCTGTFTTNEVEVPQGAHGLNANAVLPEGSEIIIRIVSGSTVYEGKVITGDSVSQKVVWNNNIDWKSIDREKVKFQFEIKGKPNEVRLYSWEFIKK